MSHNPLRRVVSTFGVVVGALALGTLVAAPALAAGSAADLTQTLHVSMKFTQTTYNPGDIAHLTVTLTNSDSSPLYGVQAGCTGAGYPNELRCIGPGWAPLTEGIDLAAGETKTVDVWETVPAVAADYGDVSVACFFGPNAQYPVNLPIAQAQAKVPGVVIDYRLRLVDHTKPIANTKVYALDPDTKQIVGRAATDETGVLEFKGIHAGLYQLYVVGPWQSLDGKPIIFSLRRPDSGYLNMELKPGPDQPDLEGSGETPPPATSDTSTPDTSTAKPTSTATTSAAADTTTAPSSTSAAKLPKTLPKTGVGVFDFSVAGLALLAAGAGALLAARRRRATN